MDLSKKILAARRKAHLSQDGLGDAIGVSDKSVSAYECGRSVPPLKKLQLIAEATKHPLSFFTGEDNMQAAIIAELHIVEEAFDNIKEMLQKDTDAKIDDAIEDQYHSHK